MPIDTEFLVLEMGMRNLGEIELLNPMEDANTPIGAPQKEIEKPNVIKSNDIIPGFEIVKVIGEGGMGKVYLVKQRSNGKLLALKTMKSDKPISEIAKEKFRREAYIQEQMNH